jgi:CelD/BcsL family acetyltransferase involved in cellulose biosynthesis
MIRVEPIIGGVFPPWIEGDWRRLCAASFKPNFQLEYEMVEAWMRHLRGDWKLLLLLAYRSNSLLGIFPLMYLDQRRRGLLPFRRIRFLAGTHTDFSGILADTSDVEDVAGACMRWLQSGEFRWELMVLDDIEGRNPAAAAIADALGKCGARVDRHEGRYLYIDLAQPWEKLWADVSKKFVRRNVSLARNRLMKAGQWSVLDHPGWSVDRVIEEAARIHQPRQAELGRGSSYEDRAWREFARAAMLHQAKSGRLRTHWLELDGTCIAYLIGFVDASVYYAWNMAFLPDFAQFYPSRFLFAEVIRQCHEKRLTRFSFMRGESEYKEKWTSRSEPNLRFAVRNTKHLYGRIIHSLERASGSSRPSP